MHLQDEPHGQDKLIHCLTGSISDFVLDVRPDSPTLGEHIKIELRGGTGESLFIPSHYAHGFVSGADSTNVVYAVSKPRSQSHEISIDFRTTSVLKSVDAPSLILSNRDRGAMSLTTYLQSLA